MQVNIVKWDNILTGKFQIHPNSLFPTCQVRVVRFYVSCLLLLLLSSSSCSTATLDAQCSLSDLNHDHPRPVFPAGPQPRPSPPSVPCRTSTTTITPSVPCRTSTTTIPAQCSLPDLNHDPKPFPVSVTRALGARRYAR